VLVTPTSDEFQHTKSIVDPTTRAARQPPATLDEVAAAIASCRDRSPRVELPHDDQAAEVLAGAIGQRAPLLWERAMAQLAETGKAQVATWNTIMTDDNLPPRFKAELVFISAVNNRAWYAAGHAAHRLAALGATQKEISALLAGDESATAAAAYRLAAKLTADPHLITDADIAAVREHFSDRETAQIVQTTCMANLFDRFTSALGLPLEASASDGLAAR
jgi:alkylhydroperoxidase family enzyme